MMEVPRFHLTFTSFGSTARNALTQLPKARRAAPYSG